MVFRPESPTPSKQGEAIQCVLRFRFLSFLPFIADPADQGEDPYDHGDGDQTAVQLQEFHDAFLLFREVTKVFSAAARSGTLSAFSAIHLSRICSASIFDRASPTFLPRMRTT